MNKGASIVSNAIVGNDFATILVNGKMYTIFPPTIHVMAGAISCLAPLELEDGTTMKDVLLSCKDAERLTDALSWFIKGNRSLSRQLSKGTLEEIVEGLGAAISLIDPKVFINAATLIRSVTKMAAA